MYKEKRSSRSQFVHVRGLRYHVRTWGERDAVAPERPALVLLHGWMDVSASFQFMVDALSAERYVIAPDWRGYGLTQRPQADCYWFPDYFADLEFLLDAMVPGQPVDLVGHSMGGNVAMIYAGVRPQRIRKLVNLEGFGLPPTTAAQAPARYARWLDQLRTGATLRPYATVQAVAERLQKNNPRLAPELADWLAPHWAQPNGAGEWDILGDPAHKLVNPVLYRAAEALACWRRITAPTLWVEGAETALFRGTQKRYTREQFERRLRAVRRLERHVIEGAGHMLHHDAPQVLARRLESFLLAAPNSPRSAQSPQSPQSP